MPQDRKVYYEKNKERINALRRASYAANIEQRRKKGIDDAKKRRILSPEKIMANKQRYDEKNREKLKLYAKAYYQKNREKFLALGDVWAKKNPEKAKAYRKEYYQKNKLKIKIKRVMKG